MTHTDARPRGLTQRLAQRVADRTATPPPEALDLAERAVVDTVACTLAAVVDRTVTTLLDALEGGLPDGSSSVFVRGRRTDARHAALIGGACAHALDLDDVDDALIGHPSAVLVPTVLAVGEEIDAGGHDVLDAYWTGLTVAREVASSLGIDGHYRLGWHSTATLGALAATAAAARLARLAPDEVQHALGIAGSLAGGSRQNFGTMTKPLHAGTAASNGVLAARLARSGFTADPDQLDGPLGFLALHAGPRANAAPHDATGSPDGTVVERPALNVKLHPCCYYLHAAADAAIELAGSVRPEDVVDVSVTVQPEGLGPLIHHRPRTGLEGKFSVEYAMAACLQDGGLSLWTFTDDEVRRPSVQALLTRVRATTRPTPPAGPPEWTAYYAVVEVRTADGRTHTRRVDRARGHADRPLTDVELRTKLEDCLSFAGLSDERDVYATLRHLRSAPSVRAATAEIAGVVADSRAVRR